MRLLIAEKPSKAKEYKAALKNETDLEVVSARGHILELVDLKNYLTSGTSSWAGMEKQLPILPPQFKHKVKLREVYNKIIEYLPRADEIILACDPDREGELIQREILEMAKSKIKTVNITRIWLKDGESKTAIQKAYQERKHFSVYEGYYNAAYTRQRIDWLIGIELTVLYTVHFNAGLLSIGRIQSWLLAEIVKRYYENRDFVIQDKWTFEFLTQKGSVLFKLIDQEEKIKEYFDKVEVDNVHKDLKDKALIISSTLKKNYTEYAPALYDLSELQKDCSRYYHLTPDKTLTIAQTLYEKHKLISYPRTDNNKLSHEEVKNIAGAVDVCRLIPELQGSVDIVRNLNFNLELNGKYIGPLKGHYAIIPTLYYDKGKSPVLSDLEKKVFILIAMRLLKALMPPVTGKKISYKGNIQKELFMSQYKTIDDPGYRLLEKQEEKFIPTVEFSKGELLGGNLYLLSGKTVPPKLYNDVTLMNLMKNAHKLVADKQLREALKDADGIGTAATRSSFAPILIKRQYVSKSKGVYIPTQKGEDLYKILPDEIKVPDFSARMEYDLWSMIEGTHARVPDVMLFDAFNMTAKIFETIRKQESTLISKVKVTLGFCPDCGNEVVDKYKLFECSHKCGFQIWKNTYGAKVSPSNAILIIKGKKSKAMKLKSKAGKRYTGYLYWNKKDKKIEMSFEK